MNAMKILFCWSLFFTQAVCAFTWPEKTPEEVGLDPSHINESISRIQSGQAGSIRSLIIIKDGHLVTERYFNGFGQKQPVFSVTKSIGSALLGMAQYQGYQLDLDQSILDYLPQYNLISNQEQVKLITLFDLLTQRHGYDWDEWSTDFTNRNNPNYIMLNSNDWYRTATGWPVLYPPGEKFAYSSGHSSLMSPILNNITGRDTDEFLMSELFTPLGITDYKWEVFNPQRPSQGITQYPSGLEPLGYGLWMKPIDMAKIGELYLKKGIWQENRLLSEDWVEQSAVKLSNMSTDPDIFTGENSGYGFQWWITRITDAENRPTDMYYANGYGRQYIFVIPKYETVIVSTANHNNISDGPGIGTIMRESLLLAFTAEEEDVFPLTTDQNGSWFDPNMDGQGINIEILNDGNEFLGFWYTYESNGGGQRWFVLSGSIENNLAQFTITSTNGGAFLNNTQPVRTEWGTGTFYVRNCSSAVMSFQSDSEAVSGDVELARLTSGPGGCIQSKQDKNLGPLLY